MMRGLALDARAQGSYESTKYHCLPLDIVGESHRIESPISRFFALSNYRCMSQCSFQHFVLGMQSTVFIQLQETGF